MTPTTPGVYIASNEKRIAIIHIIGNYPYLKQQAILNTSLYYDPTLSEKAKYNFIERIEMDNVDNGKLYRTCIPAKPGIYRCILKRGTFFNNLQSGLVAITGEVPFLKNEGGVYFGNTYLLMQRKIVLIGELILGKQDECDILRRFSDQNKTI